MRKRAFGPAFFVRRERWGLQRSLAREPQRHEHHVNLAVQFRRHLTGQHAAGQGPLQVVAFPVAGQSLQWQIEQADQSGRDAVTAVR